MQVFEHSMHVSIIPHISAPAFLCCAKVNILAEDTDGTTHGLDAQSVLLPSLYSEQFNVGFWVYRDRILTLKVNIES